jgi:hypothetical protein
MPVSPADTIDLARAVAVLYEDAEDALLRILANALAEGIESPQWARLKLAAIGDVRRAVQQVTDALQRDATGAISAAVEEAYRRGGQSAVAELGALAEGHRGYVARHLPGASAVDRLARAAVAEQGPTWGRILREPLDAYRSIVARVAGSTLLGGLTRRQTAQRALDQFATRGITSFTDVAGRRWQMASYAEMAVRSVTARAAITGHVEQLQALGQQLVIVSDAPLECPLCRPWEGEVLAINGQTGPHTLRLPHAIQPTGIRAALRGPETVVVHVAGSLPEARAAGLMHPNCRHSLSVYLPGVTERPQSPPHPQGATYEDTQHQRYLERQVRAWKRRAAAALTDADRRRANARVRAYQARIRALVDARGLQRQPAREQITSAR